MKSFERKNIEKGSICTKWMKFIFIKQFHEKTMPESNHQKHLFTGFLQSSYFKMLSEKYPRWLTFTELTSQELTIYLFCLKWTMEAQEQCVKSAQNSPEPLL